MYNYGIWLNLVIIWIIIGLLLAALFKIKKSFKGKKHMLLNEKFMGVHLTAFILLAITKLFAMIIYYEAGKYVSAFYMIDFAMDFITGSILAVILFKFSHPSYRQVIHI